MTSGHPAVRAEHTVIPRSAGCIDCPRPLRHGMGKAAGVSNARRLITSIDIDEKAGPGVNDDHRSSISALHELELADGPRLTLLDDRGWSTGGTCNIWAYETLQGLAETARTVVGPDEPPEGRTQEEEAALHWAYLADVAQEQGVSIGAGELAALPHDVDVSAAIRARLTR